MYNNLQQQPIYIIMPQVEVEKVKSQSVSCKGKEAPYDHPHLYLKIDSSIGSIDCPYCGKKFTIQ